jgi:hypothetical protein
MVTPVMLVAPIAARRTARANLCVASGIANFPVGLDLPVLDAVVVVVAVEAARGDERVACRLTDLSVYSQAKLNAVARRLNERPRKTLDYETPPERFQQTIASTG